jgi:hypothetical protein
MPGHPTLVDEQRAHRLFGNYTAIQLLGVLSRGGQPDAAALNTDRQTINDAVSLLDQMGLAHAEPAATVQPADWKVEITPEGQSFADLLEDIANGRA